MRLIICDIVTLVINTLIRVHGALGRTFRASKSSKIVQECGKKQSSFLRNCDYIGNAYPHINVS